MTVNATRRVFLTGIPVDPRLMEALLGYCSDAEEDSDLKQDEAKELVVVNPARPSNNEPRKRYL